MAVAEDGCGREVDSQQALKRFRSFFRGVHGVDPYPWQEKLVERVLGQEWPEAVALPTGSGKTAAIDIAIFHMALSHQAPRRVLYVVNRRRVVDQAEARALRIQKALREALESPPDPDRAGVRWVAERLAALSGDEDPLHVVKLRGGLPSPRHPVDDPARPAVLLSTVDQVGSRLLFRGYGLSPRAWPVEAGLLAVDTLFLLDEAHLERPFFTLLRDLEQEVAPAAEELGRPTLRAVALTATPETLGGLAAMTPSDEDRSHPYLGRLWKTPKPLALKTVKKGALVKALAEEARHLHEVTGGPVVVFCNRVDRARKVFALLEKVFRNRVLLLTGRIRPFDRDRLLGTDLQKRLDRREIAVVVTTQTLEVGADLSFMGLVTEICPLAALFQRLGRLGRRGEEGVLGVVIRAEEEPPHPYEEGELVAAWDWLERVAREEEVDAGIEALAHARSRRAPESWGHSAPIARYTPELLRLFALTDPHVRQLEPAPFLHGLEGGSPGVGLVFRADLEERWLDLNDDDLEDLSDLIPPPNAYEVLEVPRWAASAFLGGVLADRMTPDAISDLEAEASPPEGRRARKGPRPALRYVEGSSGSAGSKGSRLRVVQPYEIRSGDILFLPASYGGLDRYGWNPKAPGPVRDVAEARPPGGRPPRLLRLHPWVLRDMLQRTAWEAVRERFFSTLEGLPESLRERKFRTFWEGLFGKPLAGDRVGGPEQKGLANYFQELDRQDLARLEEIRAALEQKFSLLRIPTPPETPEEEDPEAELEAARVRGWGYLENLLRWLLDRVEPPWRVAVEGALAGLPRARVGLHPEYPGLVLRFRSEDASLGGDRPVGLEEHQEKVLKVLEDFLARLNLRPILNKPLRFGGRRHDEGKREPRMQTWLFLTAPEREPLPPPPLAKSGTRMGRREVAKRRRIAGYPKGQRHELQAAAALLGRQDPLAVHLIGTHHGHARPFPETPQDEDPKFTFPLWDGTMARADHGLDRFASGWAQQFFALQTRYTPWGLAYLEALLRLADQMVSGE